MKKYVAFFLVFVLLLGLVGCGDGVELPPDAPTYSSTDLLLYQADAFSRQIAMSAQADYLTALSTPHEILLRADVFTQAIVGEVADGKLLKDAPQTLQTTIISICGQVCGTTDLATCSSLLKSTTVHFAKKLKQPMAVYLRYSEECHFVVLFTPGEDGNVSIWAYPLFANAAQQVLEQCFSHAENLTGDAIRLSCEKGAKVSFKAKSPGKEVNADRYRAMAENIFSNVQPLSKEDITQYVNEAEIIDRTLNLSNILSNPAGDMKVYRFPGDLQNQIDDILSKTPYGQQLEDYTRQMFYLAVPNQYSNVYGVQWLAANSILFTCLNLAAPGMTAEKDEEPVLVLMEYGASCTVLLVFCPNQYNIYQYGFGIVPISSTQMQQRLWATGLQPLE